MFFRPPPSSFPPFLELSKPIWKSNSSQNSLFSSPRGFSFRLHDIPPSSVSCAPAAFGFRIPAFPMNSTSLMRLSPQTAFFFPNEEPMSNNRTHTPSSTRTPSSPTLLHPFGDGIFSLQIKLLLPCRDLLGSKDAARLCVSPVRISGPALVSLRSPRSRPYVIRQRTFIRVVFTSTCSFLWRHSVPPVRRLFPARRLHKFGVFSNLSILPSFPAKCHRPSLFRVHSVLG